jgi:hypothetical protein
LLPVRRDLRIGDLLEVEVMLNGEQGVGSLLLGREGDGQGEGEGNIRGEGEEGD